MNTLLPIGIIAVIIAALSGCVAKKAATFSSSEGQYQGKGYFNADAGSMKITATLNLKADKTYEMKINELSSLGREVGNWTQSGQQITLTPDTANEPNEVLKAMSSNKQPHTVTINVQNSEIIWADGPMNIVFSRGTQN